MSNDAVAQIKDRLSIVEVVAQYVQLAPAGKNLKGKSPFTNEKTPSFYVSPDRGMFYCFSSNQGGDIFTFTQLIEGVDFRGALKILADRAGVELVPENKEKRSERDSLYALLEEATSFYARQLKDQAVATGYLTSRGLKPETIERWRIGYAPGPPLAGWRVASEALQKKGYSVDQLLKVGLVKGADAGKAPYDVFRDRIMFPLFDSSGRVVAFSGMILSNDTEAPKYVNSPETELYNKSELLFGYDRAKEGIRKLGFSMIVEGQFDVVMSHQAGYHNTVAVSGTALTPHHVDLLQRLSQKVVLALDSDRAGIAAMRKAAILMLARGMDVKVVQMPNGADPADVIKEDVQAFKHAVGAAVHIIPFLLEHLRTTTKDARAYTLHVRESVIPFLAKMPSALEREFFIGVVAEALDSTKDAVRLEVDRAERTLTDGEPRANISATAEPKRANSYDRVAALREFVAVGASLLEPDAGSELKSFLSQHLSQPIDDTFSALTPERVSELTFTIEALFAEKPRRFQHEIMTDRVNELIDAAYALRISEQRETLKMAEAEKDEKRTADLLGVISELQKAKQGARFSFAEPVKAS